MPQYQGIWTLAQQAQAQSNQQWVTDPYFKNTTLLLQADGTGSGSQNQTFLDSSASNLYVNRYGNATQGSFSPFSKPDGQWSTYLYDGLIQASMSTNGQFGTGDFTVDIWVNPVAGSQTTSNVIWSFASYPNGIYLSYDNDGNCYVYYASGSILTGGTGALAFNTWSHVAVTRSGTSLRLFVNGIQKGSTVSDSTNYTQGFYGLGRPNDVASYYYRGYMSNFRVIKGTALYTANFTPQTTPLTAITNTQLLALQSNRYVDNSTNNYAITVSGTYSVQSFGPFAPARQWTPDVVGGSGYFDGTGDYIDVGVGAGFNLSTSDFMMEMWYYVTAFGTYAPGIMCKRVGGIATGWAFFTSGFVTLHAGTWYDSWGNPYFVGSTSSSGFNSATTLTKLNQWTHVVITRQSGVARWFVNGQMLDVQTRSSAIDQLTGSRLSVGLGGTTTEQPFIGYLSGGRISIGSVPTGYQTSSVTLNAQIFTPPTAQVSSTSQGANSSDVKYVGNFANAGIYDATMNTEWHMSKASGGTANNVQVSTLPTKFGSGSIYFDGTAYQNLLPAQNYPQLTFGTSDFTLECWLYCIGKGASTVSGIWDQRPGVNGTYVNWNLDFGGYSQGSATAPKLVLYVDSAVLTSSSVYPMSQWNHIALCRANGYTRMFINGQLANTPVADSKNYISGGSAANFRPSIGSTDGGDSLNGYIDDFRVSRFARYIANFTPPQQALPRQ